MGADPAAAPRETTLRTAPPAPRCRPARSPPTLPPGERVVTDWRSCGRTCVSPPIPRRMRSPATMSVAIEVRSEVRERSISWRRWSGRKNGNATPTSAGAATSTSRPIVVEVESTIAATIKKATSWAPARAVISVSAPNSSASPEATLKHLAGRRTPGLDVTELDRLAGHHLGGAVERDQPTTHDQRVHRDAENGTDQRDDQQQPGPITALPRWSRPRSPRRRPCRRATARASAATATARRQTWRRQPPSAAGATASARGRLGCADRAPNQDFRPAQRRKWSRSVESPASLTRVGRATDIPRMLFRGVQTCGERVVHALHAP